MQSIKFDGTSSIWGVFVGTHTIVDNDALVF